VASGAIFIEYRRSAAKEEAKLAAIEKVSKDVSTIDDGLRFANILILCEVYFGIVF
jgi:hypothetical protein